MRHLTETGYGSVLSSMSYGQFERPAARKSGGAATVTATQGRLQVGFGFDFASVAISWNASLLAALAMYAG